MLGNKKGLLLAGVAAYAYYKYNKMTPEQRQDMVGGLKEKGQKLYDEYVPSEVKNMFGNKSKSASQTMDDSNEFAL